MVGLDRALPVERSLSEEQRTTGSGPDDTLTSETGCQPRFESRSGPPELVGVTVNT